MQNLSSSSKQGGAALVVGLILLVVVTVLAISGMNTATTELALARNDQNYENAFQAAETGIEWALAQGSFNTLLVKNLQQTIDVESRKFDTVDVAIEFEDTSLVPDKAFSLGVGSGIAAYHFNATATAKSARAGAGNDTDRDASALHTQAFYVVGPESPTL
ncbi:MAG: PilX N-terminal domain-containing pilus assembly protein [Woeseia sp.]